MWLNYEEQSETSWVLKIESFLRLIDLCDWPHKAINMPREKTLFRQKLKEEKSKTKNDCKSFA